MKSMTDVKCVQTYVSRMAYCWKNYNNRQIGTVKERVYLLELAVREVHNLCGVPITSFGVLGGEDDGSFNRSLWMMKLNHSKINDSMPLDNFMELAKTLYHEARHAEQHWLVACMVLAVVKRMNSEGYSQERLRLIKSLSALPKHIIERASNVGNSFNPSAELYQKIKDWYNSMYVNRFNYDSAIQGIGTNPFADDAETKVLLHRKAYEAYRFSAHEADAFDIEILVYNGLKALLFPDNRDLIIF